MFRENQLQTKKNYITLDELLWHETVLTKLFPFFVYDSYQAETRPRRPIFQEFIVRMNNRVSK